MTSAAIARARRASLGFASGDALGTTVEFHDKASAQRRKVDAWPRGGRQAARCGAQGRRDPGAVAGGGDGVPVVAARGVSVLGLE